MRILLLLAIFFTIQPSFAQDPALLQKQFTEILKDFPNHFKNLTGEPYIMKFKLSGTEEPGILLGSGAGTYISIGLETPDSETEAQAVFKKWETAISKLKFSGIAVTGNACANPGEMIIMCKTWKFDNKDVRIDPTYMPFTIHLSVLKFQSAYAASLKIGRDL